MQNELSKKAIVIVYPDGYIEALDIIDSRLYHNDYYDIIRKKSPRISQYCEEWIMMMEHHSGFDTELTKNGCIVILNWDIRSELKEGQLSELYYLLPLTYGSLAQAHIAMNLIVGYPEIKRHLNVFDYGENRCKSCDEIDVLKLIGTQLQEMKEGMKIGKF